MLCSTKRSARKSSTRAPARPFRALELWRMKDQKVAAEAAPRAAATDQNSAGDASSNPFGTFMPASDAGTAATVSASVATVACRFRRTVRLRMPSRYSSHTSRVASTCRDISLSCPPAARTRHKCVCSKEVTAARRATRAGSASSAAASAASSGVGGVGVAVGQEPVDSRVAAHRVRDGVVRLPDVALELGHGAPQREQTLEPGLARARSPARRLELLGDGLEAVVGEETDAPHLLVVVPGGFLQHSL